MKREAVQEKLSEVKDGDYSAFIDWMMGENGKDVNRAKGGLDAVKTELDELKEEKKKLEEASLTKEQLIEKQLKEIESQRIELGKQRNTLSVKTRLADAGLSDDEISKLVDKLVCDDEAKSVENADALIEVLNSRRTAIVEETKASILKDNPRPAQSQVLPQAQNQAAFNAVMESNDTVAMVRAITAQHTALAKE